MFEILTIDLITLSNVYLMVAGGGKGVLIWGPWGFTFLRQSNGVIWMDLNGT